METIENSNKSEMYTLTGKYMSWENIIALQVTRADGETKLVKMDNIHEMIRRGLVSGCSLIQYKGNKYIKSEQIKISELPLIEPESKFKVQERMVRDNKMVGYTVSDETGKVYRFSKDKVWETARQHGIENLMAYVIGDTKVLVGIDTRIGDIPIINI